MCGHIPLCFQVPSGYEGLKFKVQVGVPDPVRLARRLPGVHVIF